MLLLLTILACTLLTPEEIDLAYDPDGDGVSFELDCDSADARILGEGQNEVSPDADDDGFGSWKSRDIVQRCATSAELDRPTGDCDDDDSGRNPGAVEICDGVDNDCNDTIDDGEACRAADSAALYLAANALTGSPRALAGSALGWLPDLDGDGWDELIIGARGLSAGSGDVGGAAILHGPIDEALGLDQADAVLIGDTVGGGLGSALVAGDDLDGDGDPDIALGGPGQAAVVFVDAKVTGSIALNEDGRWLTGDAGDWFGASLASGDLDDDGAADLIVGAPLADQGAVDAGAVFIYPGPLADGAAPWLGLDGRVDRAHAGVALSTGDLNGDGVDDLLVGGDGYGREGAVWLLYGPLDASSNLDDPDAIFCNDRDDSAGAAVLVGPDLNGDGQRDAVVGAPRDAGNGYDAGAVYVLSGVNAIYGSDVQGVFASGDVAWATLRGLRPNDELGLSVAAVGDELVPDADADGAADLLVGAPGEDDRADAAGGAWLIYGPIERADTDVDRPAGVHLLGQSAAEAAGSAVSAAGHVMAQSDDKPWSAMLIGAPYSGAELGGAAYLFAAAR